MSDMATLMSEANVYDPLSKYLVTPMNKYWTSYRNGTVHFLLGLTSKPGSVVWVPETDAGDKLPSGDPGLGGEVVGFAAWSRIGKSPVARNWQRFNAGWLASCARGMDSIRSKYQDLTDRSSDSHHRKQVLPLIHEPHHDEIFPEVWELKVLVMELGYQRQGLGKILVRWGLNQADADRVPVLVTFSSAGYRLYTQCGFRSISSIDLRAFFDPGENDCHTLVWEPHGMADQWYL